MKKKLIVIGGGFAGLQFLRNLTPDIFDVLLIDKLNHHQFQPLFYQVATSQIEPSSISFPLRKIFHDRNDIRIRMAEVKEIDGQNNLVITSIGNFPYDYLVIATGCKTNYFGNEVIKTHALSLKTTHQATKIRNAILENFERILYAPEEELEGLFNIIIVGGGPTGVELAGAFAEIKRDILPKDFFRIDFSKLRIILLEGSPNTLNSMSSMAKKASRKYLEQIGVEIKTGVYVTNYDGQIATLNSGDVIKCKNLIWAAGVTGNIILGLSAESYARGNRLKVNRFNRIENYNNIFAIGDIAYMSTPKYPNGHPQLANVAINQGKYMARNIKAIEFGGKLKEYEYYDMGSMATIGKNKAVVDLPFMSFKGYFAWFIWMFLHLMLILSVRNKLIIFINWAWNYITKNSSLRLILKGEDE
jgi:NADH dehydrogenase